MFAQTAADFNVTLNDVGDGVIITGYSGKITAVRIPATIGGLPVKEIGDGAFGWKKSSLFENRKNTLVSVVIPPGVTKIGTLAFDEQEVSNEQHSLTSVTLPAGIVEIGAGVFSFCAKLTALTLPASLTKIGGYAFSESGLKNPNDSRRRYNY